MRVTSDFCSEKDLSIRRMPSAMQSDIKDYVVETSSFTLCGAFPDLLEYVHQLEKQRSLGVIKAIRFYVQKDTRSKKKELLLDLYVQNLIKKQ